ncbi:unnamed protein product [Rotaria sordida]|uniref:Uncharacterized protein n=1 Tax=Rotaria sordida TaxID=392033 RepID=A0A818YFW7_9BILA|nr:unnamed protein product [Rotaria sordida]
MPNKNRKAQRAAQRAAAAASNNNENEDAIDNPTSTTATSVLQSSPSTQLVNVAGLVETAPVTNPPLSSATLKSAWTPQAPPASAVQPNATAPPQTVSSEPSAVPKPTPDQRAPSQAELSAVPKQAWASKFSPQSTTSVTPKPAAQKSEPSAVPKATANPLSQGAYRTDRAASAYPMARESISSLTTTDSGISLRQSRSQSVISNRGGGGRRFLLSAVPDTANLTPMLRPDAGGSKGRPISIYTNHFPVQIDYNATVNQYDVEIMLIDQDGNQRVARKDERWKVMQLIVQKKKDFPVVWYDEGKTLYTRELLPDITKPIRVQMERDTQMKTFQLTIKNLVRQEMMENILKFVKKQLRTRPREAVRVIETLFKQRARNELVCVKNQFYNRKQTLDDLHDGRGMAKGFYQALFLTRLGPTLNVNLTFTCFYMPMNFIQFACEYLREDITKGFPDYKVKVFRQIIRDLLIETEHTTRNIRYKLHGFGRPANQLAFTPREASEEISDPAPTLQEITVEKYFEQKYNIKLKYPHLPCIDARSGPMKRANYLPMEMVKVVEWQRALKPLDTTQRARTTSKSIIKPDQRYKEIMNIMDSRDFEQDPYLKQLNIHVDKTEMLQIKGIDLLEIDLDHKSSLIICFSARILNPPEIRFRQGQGQNEIVESVNVGKWRIGRNRFYQAPEIKSWGLIYYGHNPNQQMNKTIDDFANQLPELLRRKGFIIRSDLKLVPIIETSNIEKSLTEGSKKGWQLAIVILNTDASQSYSDVKQIGHQKLGLRTQCIDWKALCRNMDKLHMYVENLSQKINVKLGGINSIVNTKLALTQSSRNDLFMFFGADVTHSTSSTDRPSVAAVVASREPTSSLYAARLCEQYPKKGRCSIEIIKELDKMVEDLLRVFARTCNGHLPNKIVFYRDGVDEGHFEKVLGNEVNKIKEACRRVYGNRPLPSVTFIVVKKRHNTRFFLYENGQTLNVQPGTIVDQDITHPSQFDFYLCSQAALMGTARPTLYHVLHDDDNNKFSSDDIQQLTYWLCHTDMRCTKSVSIPAPVYYAHLAAYGSRSLDFDANHPTHSDGNDKDDNDDEDVDDEDDPTSYSLEDIKTKVMIFDPKVANDMWFI